MGRLAADQRLGLDAGALDAVLDEPLSFVGTAPEQVEAFITQVEELVAKNPDAAGYTPATIL
jgi:adenylosuccinate lyase